MSRERPAAVPEGAGISVLIPTYQRHEVLVETLEAFLDLRPAPAEIVVVDQSPTHPPGVEAKLTELEAAGAVRRLRRSRPSIPGAMNDALLAAKTEYVLFTDDDVEPAAELLAGHLEAHRRHPGALVAGQVLQPGEVPEPLEGERFAFRSSRPQEVSELMGGNFSAPRALLRALGGFDERFVGAAYRFERELADRARRAGVSIRFEPAASLRHLRAGWGGTRAWGDHLRTARPSHAVGEYYYLLRAKGRRGRWRELATRPLRAVRTRHHLRRPWWVPATLLAELSGFAWALALAARGPRLLQGSGAGG